MPGAQTRDENAHEGMQREALAQRDVSLQTDELADKYGRRSEHPLFARDEWRDDDDKPAGGYWAWVREQLGQELGQASPADAPANVTTNESLRALLNKQVKVVNEPNLGAFHGRLAGFKPGQFALRGMFIINPDGTLKAASERGHTRWFPTAGCTVGALPLSALTAKVADLQSDAKARLAELTRELVQGLINREHPDAKSAAELDFLAAFYTPQAALDARTTLSAVDAFLCG